VEGEGLAAVDGGLEEVLGGVDGVGVDDDAEARARADQGL